MKRITHTPADRAQEERAALAEQLITKYTPSATVQALLRQTAKSDPDRFHSAVASAIVTRLA